jgi:hypothetical protein
MKGIVAAFAWCLPDILFSTAGHPSDKRDEQRRRLAGLKKPDEENPFDRFMIFAVTAVSTLMSFLFAALLVAMVLSKVLFEAGSSETEWAPLFIVISSGVVALLTSVLVAWKSSDVFRKLLARMRSRLPEPAVSCLAFAVVGSILFGSVVPAAFLVLGHTRPVGWDASKILPLTGFGFALFLLLGLQSGLIRRRGRKP